MIKSGFVSSLALAAFLAAPAFAQTTTANGAYVAPLEKASAQQQTQADPAQQAKADSTTKSTVGAQADVSAGTTTVNGANVAPLEKASAKQQATASPAKQAKADNTAKSTTGAKADVSCGTKTVDGAYVAPLEKNSAQQQAAADGTSTSQMSADCVAKPVKTAKKKSVKTAAK